MERRTLLAGGALLVGTLTLGIALFSPQSDEEQIRETLDALAEAVSFSEPIGNPVFYGSHLSDQFKELMTDPVQVRVSEVQGSLPSNRGRLGLAAAQVLTRYGALHVGLGDLDINVNGDQASVKGTATVTALGGGRPKRDERPIRFELVKDGDWVVSSVMVQAAR